MAGLLSSDSNSSAIGNIPQKNGAVNTYLQEYGRKSGMRPGDSAIAHLLGITPQTVAKGRRELLDRDVEVERVRRVGGGRATIKKNAGNH
jgi:hypothetical protein